MKISIKIIFLGPMCSGRCVLIGQTESHTIYFSYLLMYVVYMSLGMFLCVKSGAFLAEKKVFLW